MTLTIADPLPLRTADMVTAPVVGAAAPTADGPDFALALAGMMATPATPSTDGAETAAATLPEAADGPTAPLRTLSDLSQVALPVSTAEADTPTTPLPVTAQQPGPNAPIMRAQPAVTIAPHVAADQDLDHAEAETAALPDAPQPKDDLPAQATVGPVGVQAELYNLEVRLSDDVTAHTAPLRADPPRKAGDAPPPADGDAKEYDTDAEPDTRSQSAPPPTVALPPQVLSAKESPPVIPQGTDAMTLAQPGQAPRSAAPRASPAPDAATPSDAVEPADPVGAETAVDPSPARAKTAPSTAAPASATPAKADTGRDPAPLAETAPLSLRATADPAPQMQMTAAPTATPASPGTSPIAMNSAGWEGAIAERIVAELSGDGSSIDLDLTPEHLGKLRITLEILDGQAQVRFLAETPEAARLIQQSEHRLSESLSRAGLSLGGQDSSSRDAQTPQQSQQNQTQQQGDRNGRAHSRQTEAIFQRPATPRDVASPARPAGGRLNLIA